MLSKVIGRDVADVGKARLNSEHLFPVALAGSLILHLLVGILIIFWPQDNPVVLKESMSVQIQLGTASQSGLTDEGKIEKTDVQVPSVEQVPPVEKIASKEQVLKETGKSATSPEVSVPIQPEVLPSEDSPVFEAQETEIPIRATEDNHTNPSEISQSEPSGGAAENSETFVPLERLSGLKGQRSLPPPPYPESAKRFNYEGTVLVEIVIDSRGKVLSASVLQSDAHSILENICLKTIKKKWKFLPTGREVTTRKEFHFVLDPA